MPVQVALVSTLLVVTVLAACAERSGGRPAAATPVPEQSQNATQGASTGSADSATATAPDEIADGVYLVLGKLIPGRPPDGNTVIFRAPEGALIVDTGRHREHTQAVLDGVAALGLVPRVVVNTHWHLDHIGGNLLVRERHPDVRILASNAIAEARTGFLANYHRQLEQMVASDKPSAETKESFRRELALIDAADRLAPDEVIATSGPRTLAGRPIDVHLETRAVTAGDVWLLDPATKVAVAGDLITIPAPFLDTACPTGWQTALAHVAEADWTLLIPGHGPPMSRADFDTYRRTFDALLTCAASTRPSTDCVNAWFTHGGELIAKNDPGNAREMVNYYVEQVLRGDSARIAKYCGAELSPSGQP